MAVVRTEMKFRIIGKGEEHLEHQSECYLLKNTLLEEDIYLG